MTENTPVELEVLEVELISINTGDARLPTVHIVLSEDSQIFKNDPSYEGVYIVDKVQFIEADEEMIVQFSSREVDGVLKSGDPTYSVALPLQYVQTSQMVSMWVAGPNFILSSGIEDNVNGEEIDISDDTMFISFPTLGTPEFIQIVAAITKATTGQTTVNIDTDVFNEVRSEAISLIMDLVNGDEAALLKVYSLINPLDQLLIDQKKSDFVLNKEQEKLVILRDLFINLQAETHPASISPAILEHENPEEFISDVEDFETMMKQNGFEDSFFHEINNVAKLTLDPNATGEEKIAFLSAPFTKENLPGKMGVLASKITLDLFFNRNWNAITSEESEEDVRSGDYLAAVALIVAARLSRMQQMYTDEGRAYSPVIILAKALSIPNEPIFWAMNEAVKLLASDKTIPFNELLECTVPDPEEPRSALQAPLGMILHQFGHMILKEEWAKEILSIALKEQPIIVSFLSDLYQDSEESHDKHNGDRPCIPAQAAINLFSIGFTIPDIIDQLGKSLLALAELNAFKHTNFQKGSIDWNDYTKSYLGTVIEGDD